MDGKNRPVSIVISGINLFEGGPLRIYYDFLDAILKLKDFNNYKITIFVHKKDLFSDYSEKIDIIELPFSRISFLFRLYYEYIFFYIYSRINKVDIWISIHDITPTVLAKKRFVYCHNPCVFDQQNKELSLFSLKKILYARMYEILYKINIKYNTAVIVQSDWIARKFKQKFGIKNIVIARPVNELSCDSNKFGNSQGISKPYKFFYPAFPRRFKNIEVICNAVKIINRSLLVDENDFLVLLTIDGSENSYSREIVNIFSNEKNINFIGLQKFEKVKEYYNNVDCLIFPSKLETWGLPISEFKSTGKSMLLADMPYAHETLGDYKNVSFFSCDSQQELADKMIKCVNGTLKFDKNEKVESSFVTFNNWRELIDYIIQKE